MFRCVLPAPPPLPAVDPRRRAELQRKASDAAAEERPAAARLAELGALEKELARAGLEEDARTLRAYRQRKDAEWAERHLSGEELGSTEALALAKRLAGYKLIGLARRVLKLCRRKGGYASDKERREVHQRSALYTYKDPDLPAEWRLDEASRILKDGDDPATSSDPETLGLAGAIAKRTWELTGSRSRLERSLSYYLKGYALGAPAAAREDVLGHLRRTPGAVLDASKDQGYCGINAAFILDLLAHEEEVEGARLGVPVATATARRADARLIRREIVRSVPPLVAAQAWLKEAWWFHATIGEAYFGLRKYCHALRWLVVEPAAAGLRVGFGQTAPAGLDVPEWEYESTARQLARLASLQGRPGLSDAAFARTHAAEALRRFLQGEEKAVLSAFRGKFGLALSGGGFRASFFHIGVLARLAEADLLRHVEVLSCVSGGSIVGAHYYLKLKRRLEEKPDGALDARDYRELVEELERHFLEGVQKNIRMRVLADPIANLKMLFCPGYTRTQRVGELYEKHLYARDLPGGPAGRPPSIADLLVRPRLPSGGPQADFRPRDHNWRRAHKVPILVLNATSLNTGHDWQFTAAYMGEPPTPINADIDTNERLRRMWYRDAPAPYRDAGVRLGHAVAASSCVPALFEPLALDGLYPDRSVRLVDGGVCDNQGVASLVEQDCSVVLVSDGSGQMDAEKVPSDGLLGVPLRSNSILQARVREAQHGDLAARRRSGALRGLLFVHLRQDLPGAQVTWKDCPASRARSDFDPEVEVRDRTAYGVDLDLQRKLSAIRTDLDSFSDAEAFSLMASGYRMTDHQLRSAAPIDGLAYAGASVPWEFLTCTAGLAPGTPAAQHLGPILEVGRHTAFKAWRLLRPLALAGRALLVVALAAVVAAAWRFRSARVVQGALAELTIGKLAWTVAGLLGFMLLSYVLRNLLGSRTGRLALKLVRFRSTLRDVAVGVGMGLVGWMIALVHLKAFDPLFLRHGGRDRIPR